MGESKHVFFNYYDLQKTIYDNCKRSSIPKFNRILKQLYHKLEYPFLFIYLGAEFVKIG